MDSRGARQAFPVVKPAGESRWMAKCPAHEDRLASLSVRMEHDKLLLKCHAGCSIQEICAAAKLSLKDLFVNPDDRQRVPRKVVARYIYRDEQGTELFRVIRFEPKEFSCGHVQGGAWIGNMEGVRRVPYHLDEITKLGREAVFVCEGEKAADRVRDVGFLATCSNGGAGKWQTNFGHYFRGRKVIVLPDNDEPGIAHACLVAGSCILNGAASVRIVELPELPEKADPYDFIERYGAQAKQRLIEAVLKQGVYQSWRPKLERPIAC